MNPEIQEQKKVPFKIIFIILLLILIANTIFLDFVFIKNGNIFVKEEKINSGINLVQNKVQENLSCPDSCLSRINEATSSVKTQEIIVSPTVATPQIITNSSSVKEYYISFGSGSNASDDWVDVTGLQAYIDSTKYNSIKSAVFEATVNIPTGNEAAYVRLYNVTDKHPVWLSEISLTGGDPQLLVSQSITLDKGSKLYQVQMKTTLKYQAVLNQARLHITLN